MILLGTENAIAAPVYAHRLTMAHIVKIVWAVFLIVSGPLIVSCFTSMIPVDTKWPTSHGKSRDVLRW